MEARVINPRLGSRPRGRLLSELPGQETRRWTLHGARAGVLQRGQVSNFKFSSGADGVSYLMPSSRDLTVAAPCAAKT